MPITIQYVVEQNLCAGCGICIAICPKNALLLTQNSVKGVYFPIVDDDKCDKCGLCLKVCPGVSVDFKNLNLDIFGKEPESSLIGNYLNCYVGYSADKQIRYNSASGGLVTALIGFALEEGIVNGALVTRMRYGKQLKPYPFIAETKAESDLATSSKYCPVPANIALKGILNKEGRYIVVGLPCHIEGVRKAGILKEKLRNRVSYCFGLVCHHTPTFNATKYLLKKLKIPENMVAKLDYRGNGWPGGIKIVLKNRSKLFIPEFSPYYWGMLFERFFWPSRCIVCEDRLCELADITFMDAWLREFSSDDGNSLIVVRSQKGKKLVEKAMELGFVKLQPISEKKIYESTMIKKLIKTMITRRRLIELIFKKAYPLYKSSPFSRSSTNSNYANIPDALHFALITELCGKVSNISRFVIESHVALWKLRNLLRKIER